MKFSTTRILLLIGCYSLGIDARQMHANVDYSRYLEQKDNVTDALQEWMDLYGPYASQKGLIPTSESRSADDTQEDHRQRFFMAQQLVEKLNAESKGAVFSTHSPFTLLTEQEFAEYVRNSYVAGDSKTRRLREAVKEENNAQGAIGESQSLDKKEPNQEAGNVNPSSFDFKALFRKWIIEMIGLKTEERERSIASFDFGDVTIQPDAVAPVVPYDPASMPEPAPVERFPFPFPWGPVSPTDAPEPAPVDPPVQPDTQPTEEPWGPVSPSYAPGPAPGPVSPTTEGVAAMTVDWATNTCMPPIQDQGRCGSCWAFASISAVETSQCLSQKSSTVIKYSENNLATCDQRNQGCNGGTPGYALDFIQQNGVCNEADDPYTGQGGFLGSCSSCNRVQTGMKGYTTLSGDADLVSALNQGPVIIALSGSNAAFKHYQSGPLTVAECPEYANIDHAVVAVGYNDNVIKIRNSWGPRWGVNGYVYIDRTPSSSEGTCGIYTYMKQVQF